METKNQKIENLLDVLGVRGKEREVYTLCFLSGPLPAIRISKELRINRAAVYQMINSLIEKGLLKK